MRMSVLVPVSGCTGGEVKERCRGHARGERADCRGESEGRFCELNGSHGERMLVLDAASVELLHPRALHGSHGHAHSDPLRGPLTARPFRSGPALEK